MIFSARLSMKQRRDLLSIDVAKEIFKLSTPCNAVQFEVELIKKKLDRRISRTAG